ncbi:unnamed protein product, partial [Linum tenue]
ERRGKITSHQIIYVYRYSKNLISCTLHSWQPWNKSKQHNSTGNQSPESRITRQWVILIPYTTSNSWHMSTTN